jgi:hypothetical protein
VGKQGEKSFLVCWVDHLLARTAEPIAVFAAAVNKYAHETFRRANIGKLVAARFALQTWVIKYVREMKNDFPGWLDSPDRARFIARLEDTHWPMPEKFEGKGQKFPEGAGAKEFVERAEQVAPAAAHAAAMD